MTELTPRQRRALEATPVGILVNGELRYVPRELWKLMLGPKPPKSFDSNGCGPQRCKWLAWLVPDEVDHTCTWLACHYHDHLYGVGGTWADRWEADVNLGRNVATILRWFGGSVLRAKLIGFAYFLGVRLGGWACYRYRWARGEAPVTRAQVVRERLGLFRDKR